MARSNLTRRNFLAGLGVGVAGVALAACGGAAPAPTAAPAAPAAAAPAAAPTNTAAAAAAAAPAATNTPAAAAAAATKTPAAAAAAAAATNTPAAAAAAAPAGAASGAVNWLVRTTPQENNGQSTIFEPALAAALPNVKISRIIVPAAEYIPKINTMAAANESLEIWGFGGNYFDYWARKLPQSLDSYVSADKWDVKSYFLPGLPEIYTVKGHLYGLPQLTCYGSNVVYNKDLYDAAGLKHPPLDYTDTTWNMDRVLSDATKLTKNYGAPDATYGLSMAIWDRMTSLSYLWGGDSWLPEHYTSFIAQKTNFSGAENIAGHQWRQDLIYKQKVHPDPAVDQGLNQFANPFKTGKIGIVMDGGWQYWTTSDITEFKVGVAPMPTFKTNKSIIFDDFWIMGRWAKNKDAAWQVLRVLTNVENTTKYSILSGTPPTPRESTTAWAQTRADFFGVPLADMNKMLAQSIDKRVQESPDHLFLQHPKIDDTYNNEIAALWNHSDATAAGVFPAITKVMDDTVLAIYNQFKDVMPAE